MGSWGWVIVSIREKGVPIADVPGCTVNRSREGHSLCGPARARAILGTQSLYL